MNKNLLYKVLVIWTIIGAILNLDFNQIWGCIVGYDFHLIYYHISFTIISFSLWYFAWKSTNQKNVLILIMSEIFIWVIKYLILKGGYVYGIFGVINSTHLIYDILSLSLRILLFLVVFTRIKPLPVKEIILSIIFISGIITIKIIFFRTPIIFL